MPQTLLSAIFSSPTLKIKNQTTLRFVLVPIRTVRVGLLFPSKLAHHQMEDGSTRIDQRVLQPIGINIELIAPSMDVLGQVNSVTLDRENLYSISARGLVVENMRVIAQAADQSPENLSSTPVKLSFVQTLFQGITRTVYYQAADASLLDRGSALLQDAQGAVSGAIDKVKSFL